MFDFEGNIRLSIKAIIIRDKKILLTYNSYRGEEFYLLPGGGQKHGEPMDEAIKRECLEEIGYHVELGQLIFIRDYIGKNHQFAKEDQNIHQVELMFSCQLLEGNVKNAKMDDSYQIGVQWVRLDDLKEINIYPSILKEVIHSDGTFNKKVYLGDSV
ncbi:MAG TPA: NUDIX domain-containing protein [Clostridia bacterium]|nr:NUDIX domain-containing protein [Clostridia bacterium]